MNPGAHLDRKAQRAIRRIAAGYDPDVIMVYGSYARGDYHRGSDLDLLIIKDTTATFLERLDAVLDLCDGEIAVEPRVYRPAELARMQAEGNDFIHTVLKEGVVVYERQQPAPGKPLAQPGAK